MKKKSICPIQYWAGNLSNEKQLIKPAPKFNCQKNIGKKKSLISIFPWLFTIKYEIFEGFLALPVSTKFKKKKNDFTSMNIFLHNEYCVVVKQKKRASISVWIRLQNKNACSTTKKIVPSLFEQEQNDTQKEFWKRCFWKTPEQCSHFPHLKGLIKDIYLFEFYQEYLSQNISRPLSC